MNNTNFGNRYDEIYRNGMQKNVWPWTSVITIMHKLKKDLDPNSNILELGCGMGANIKLIQSLGYEYHGIDFSNYAINEIKKTNPDLSSALINADFTKKISFFNKNFDLILDRASLTCNQTSSIRNSIELIKMDLVPGGYFVGIDWMSTDHSEFKKGEPQEDRFSRVFDKKQSIFDPPRMHFSDKQHIYDLFKDFKIIHLEHKLEEVLKSEFITPVSAYSWDFIARLN